MVAGQRRLDELDVARPVWTGAPVSERVVRFRQHAFERDATQDVVAVDTRSIDGEVATQLDGASGVAFVTEPPVENGTYDGGFGQLIEELRRRACAVEARYPRVNLQHLESRAQRPTLALQVCATSVETEFPCEASALEQLSETLS